MIEARLVESVAKRTRLQDGPVSFHSVTTDSRKDSNAALFVPLSGERFNGHHYLDSAIASGAIAAIWQEQEPVPTSIPASFQLYFVDDPLHALQELAQLYRDEINPYVIGITGSNGKTTTKDIVFQLLGGEPFVHRTAGNLNNHIGVPLTLLSMPKECKFAVVEMGMNHAGEISFLSKLAKPDLAIVTNIGEAHIEHLGSRQGIASAKMEMLDGLKQDGFLVLDGDEPLLNGFQQEKTVSIGFNHQNKEAIATFQPKEDGFTFSFLDEKDWYLPLLGEHNVKNAAYGIWIARQVGFAPETIKERLANVTITGMRLEKVAGPNGSTFINDAYNANPSSMKAAIETIKSLPEFKRRIVVLGDIYELGPDEEALHRSVVSAIDTPITNVVCVGEKGYWIYDEVKQQNGAIAVEHVENVSDVAETIRPLLNHDTVVLLKASRRLALEQVLSAVKGGA
ncbi:UDP-N-acetylmuramoyl-tripeptide--D-alanyl-D-alanine ligase [Shouchella lehensis]|uniref:UDP-N-acetylmuramoyl-tripeptide--D-alanyl-D-alanine ligase n=1 Tax=Shouchella lehensis TaxID=300825 RepID=A0A4Y7WQV1_9BACI|nr:UDP-N-acetylmuramoyl-tripeptide--D-alanyl-D-alanine ligase [Shouchella lehensis]MBG9784229.1 UDP-N-acetylmuramoylalanyl-D-glutamate--2,6-diaminopimelate ligase [Shouchella lehensis]TES50781.1 UDP-N-acetylmuramoyl-tripeptide--D-alanyl-D-alanine ligase [Shouchella lehensis]